LKFGEEDELKDLIARAEVLHPEFSARPRVYYLGLPKSFITGAVYDPKKDECVTGAKVVLTDSATGEKFIAETDHFGDFWFKELKAGTFSLAIKAEGYRVKTLDNINTEKDVNLGDIPLSVVI